MSWFSRIFRRNIASDCILPDNIKFQEFYGYNDSISFLKLELRLQDEWSYIARFTFKNKVTPEHSLVATGILNNVDPEGLASFTELDTLRVGNPAQFYASKNKDIDFNIYVPYNDTEYVGVQINFTKPNPANLSELRQTLWRYEPEHK